MSPVNNRSLELELLETDAGQAVFDALIQANVDLRSVSLDVVKEMLNAECRHRRIRAPYGMSGRICPDMTMA